MKYIILFSLTLISLKTFSQSVESCSYDKVVSFSGGVPFNAQVEFTMQGDLFGATAGLKSFLVTTMHPQSQVKFEQSMNVEPFVKGDIKLLGNEDDWYRVYGNAYYGIKVYGIGLKTAAILNDELAVFLESSYGESKLQINGGISLRL